MQNKLFGSALIIAGTTIGAGMLALPLASAGLGLGLSVFIMVGMWTLMTFTAMLMLEVHQHAPAGATLNTLAHQFLGKKGQWFANFATMFLLYALCAAYIAGGGSQLQTKLALLTETSLPSSVGVVGFTLLIATIVSLGTSKVDLINRGLFALKIIMLILALALLTPHISSGHLVEMPLEKGLLLSAIPVIFTSFGFHGSIPSVVAYVGLDVRALRKVMVVGSGLPLLIYVFWQAASLGSIGQAQLITNDNLAGFIMLVGQVVHSETIASAISVFADLALATSFLGVSLGLFDFLRDALNRESSGVGRLQTSVCTFLPPMVVALFYPQGFAAALGYAAIALVMLGVVLPVLMARKVRMEGLNKGKYQVAGGSLSLMLALLIGMVIILIQLISAAS
ncbi:aromatic amino acid transport family protein [Veronia pacifica]|uniref:Aromatic amino acid permease n=1 Tax=Veronia pacifica TaxID=1080227 RepID=A0A1C3EM49_9GAMM|nr:aromatic amino acid transport family protein [Veronia pacifica]ODA34295.1 tyrosine transporter TyrP [Veronia pacifica]